MGYYNEYSNIKSMNPSSKIYYLKKLTQILLSVSVFSFLFSQSSLVPVLVHSYDYVVSKYSIKLFTYKAERNYIFLLCNGILVLIIRTSGLISKATPVQTSSKGGGIGDSHDQKTDEPGFQEKNKAEKITTKVEVIEENDEEECGIVAAEVESTKEDCKSFDQIEELEEDEEEEEEGIDGELSTDELKKKFEDFIKKVKQEIQATK